MYAQQQYNQGYAQQNQGYAMANNQMPSQPVQYQPVQFQAVNIEQSQQNAPAGPPEWKNSLFGCFSDLGSCIITCFLPCVQYGMNYEKVHHSGCCSQACVFFCLSQCCLNCCVHKDLRSDIRRKYNIEEGCGDCLTTCFCSPCAICQEARELKDRGAH